MFSFYISSPSVPIRSVRSFRYVSTLSKAKRKDEKKTRKTFKDFPIVVLVVFVVIVNESKCNPLMPFGFLTFYCFWLVLKRGGWLWILMCIIWPPFSCRHNLPISKYHRQRIGHFYFYSMGFEMLKDEARR